MSGGESSAEMLSNFNTSTALSSGKYGLFKTAYSNRLGKKEGIK